MSETLYLFDVSAYLHRAMYACYRDAVDSVDPSNSAFIRYATTLLASDMELFQVKYMALVADSTEPSLRCDMFSAYKAGRRDHPAVFRKQVPRFFQQMRDVSVAVLEEPRYEADDIIASTVLSRESCIAIVSLDKDLLAYVSNGDDGSPTVEHYNPLKREWSHVGDVEAKFQVTPEQLHDYIGLVGDSVDGIPGVRGIGPKTAAQLLRTFSSLEALYQATEAELRQHVSTRQVKLLSDGKADAFLSRELARPRISTRYATMPLSAYRAPSPNVVRGAIT
jgi:DNA polymerase-1